MISFFYETEVCFKEETSYKGWLSRIVASEGFLVGALNFIFCDDEYLLKINEQYLNHNDYTDIITFDYSESKFVSGDIFISVERVKDNAKKFSVSEEEELQRVMAHGILHLCGYKDKTEEDSAVMRKKEDEKIEMFHVEQPCNVSRGTLKE